MRGRRLCAHMITAEPTLVCSLKDSALLLGLQPMVERSAYGMNKPPTSELWARRAGKCLHPNWRVCAF